MDDFEAHRDHLRAVAYRMLGSSSEADDALQEAWLRLSRGGTHSVVNTRAWLTTIVARICLDMLRSRRARHEVALGAPSAGDAPDPESEVMLADSVGLALQVVLDTLTPPERLAFVLHDMFAVPFGDIAPILGRSVPATKMLASRARRRVRAAETPTSSVYIATDAGKSADPGRRWAVVEAFLAASREGDFAALLELLDPEVTVTADTLGGTRLSGAHPVAEQALTFSHRARDASVGMVDGVPAILVTPRGRLVTVMTFRITGGRISSIEVISDPRRLGRLRIA